jgi:3-hydroxy acid dehydrogenase / malonic semialdehyde reductase
MHNLKRTILVTGASSGIGRAVGRRLIEQGHFVIGVSRNCNRFVTAKDNFYPLQLDLAKVDELPDKIREIEKQFQALDSVIFSAGIGRFGSLEEFSYSQIQDLMNINFISPAFLTRALLPFLKHKSRSDLIYIGSEAALKGSRKGTIYCASKFALRGFTQALREECSKDQVRVCLINPGIVKTAFFDKLSFEPGDDPSQYLLADDVAQAVCYAINSRAEMVIEEITLNPASKVIKKK